MLLISSIFYVKMATQKFTNFGNFLKMHTDMAAVMISGDEIVSNEVKDSYARII